jgi:hypothetical protein
VTDLIFETHGLTKEFVGFFAVRDVALKVRRGSIHAVGDGGDLRADLPPRRDRGDRALFQARTLTPRQDQGFEGLLLVVCRT